MPDLISTVSALLWEASQTCVMPVFGKLAADPKEKSPGEWITEADMSCEAFLEPALHSLIPGSLVIGEEAASENPNILHHLDHDTDVWLVDPLDGTANFAKGETPFALMVALIRNRETVASWILEPLANQLSVSEKGSGSWINNQQINVSKESPELKNMAGAVLRRFLPQELATHINEVEGRFAKLSAGSKCAGFDYPSVANGTMDFVLYWRTLPWDHAAGVLFLEEAGGYAARPDGTKFRVSDYAEPGLLVAQNKATWSKARSALFI